MKFRFHEVRENPERRIENFERTESSFPPCFLDQLEADIEEKMIESGWAPPTGKTFLQQLEESIELRDN